MRRAAITGLGAVTGLGIGVAALWDGLLAGVQATRRYPALGEVGLDLGPVAKVLLPEDEALLLGEPDDGRALLDGRPRAVAMALLAAEEALSDAGLLSRARERSPKAPFRLGVSVGTTLGEKAPWVQALRAAAPLGADFGISAPARAVARAYDAQCLRVVSAACASGNAALGVALSWIRSGACDAVLCGGVDAICEFVLSGFFALRAHAKEPCRPFDRDRSGLNLGEGAAFLLVESEEHAHARGRAIRAYLDGFGMSCDANHMTGPDRQGRGAARAMTAALHGAQLPPAAVDFVSAHGTATVFNDLMEAHGLAAVLGAASAAVPVNSIKGSLGHALGAAGTFEAVMVVRALEEQRIPPTAGLSARDAQIPLDVVSEVPRAARLMAALSTSSGFGGVNASVVLRRAEPTPPGRPASAGRSRCAEDQPSPVRALPCAVIAVGALFPRAEEPLAPFLPAGAPPERGGQLFRMDRLCALAVCAAERALAGVWQAGRALGWPSERIGVLVGSTGGCHKTDEEYYRTVLQRQPSPRLFAYTLPSSAVGELSILYELRGPGLAVVSGPTAGVEALAEARALLHEDQADACLVIAAEVAAPALPAVPAGAGEPLVDAAVALLLVRADSPLVGEGAAFGYLAGIAAAYRHSRPRAALACAAATARAEAAVAEGDAFPVLADALTRRALPPELRAAAIASGAPPLDPRQGAAAPLQGLVAAAASGSARALILSADRDGQAAGVLWSRARP